MKAMVLRRAGEPLKMAELADPRPGPRQVAVRVNACAVCRTDLHVADGELREPELPLVLGHQIVGVVEETGREVSGLEVGQRVGVPWLGSTCGHCGFCESGRENLCDEARFTGYQLDGGYAEKTTADAQFCLPLPDGFPDLQAAPLLCAGLIGYRTLRFAGEAETVGLYGFGAAAHITAQVIRHQRRRFFAFTRPGDRRAQELARSLGAEWAGGSDQAPPQLLDAALIFAPVGPLVSEALRHLRKGGVVVCGGIHMSDIPSIPYELLWGERVVRSVANLTRRDGEEFLRLAPQIPIETRVRVYPLSEANAALDDLRAGRLDGSAVLEIAATLTPPESGC